MPGAPPGAAPRPAPAPDAKPAAAPAAKPPPPASARPPSLLPAAAWARIQAAGAPAWVAPHCRAVAGLADAMCRCAGRKGLAVDRRLVVCAALLHDVGRSLAQDVRHAWLGADLLRKEGWPEPVALCVERHTGGGIDAGEAARLGLPVKDYTPQTLEERIVCHADNLFGGSKRLSLVELEGKYRAKGLDAAWEKIARLHAGLGRQLGVDLERLEPAELRLD